MNLIKEEFKKFLKEIGFLKETEALVRVIKLHEDKISLLEDRVSILENKIRHLKGNN